MDNFASLITSRLQDAHYYILSDGFLWHAENARYLAVFGNSIFFSVLIVAFSQYLGNRNRPACVTKDSGASIYRNPDDMALRHLRCGCRRRFRGIAGAVADPVSSIKVCNFLVSTNTVFVRSLVGASIGRDGSRLEQARIQHLDIYRGFGKLYQWN